MNKMIACCGLNCETCDAYLATIHNDDTLRRKTAALWAKLNNAPITPQMINCNGCRMDGAKTPFCQSMCEIRICVASKGFATCGDCVELEHCPKLSMVTHSNPTALATLKDNRR